MKHLTLLLATLMSLFFCGVVNETFAQNAAANDDKEQAYTRVINERAAKIVSVLGITDTAKAGRIRAIVANQYRSLNEVHNYRIERTKTLKSSQDSKENIEMQVKHLEDESNIKLDKLHVIYLSALSAELTPAQVDQVKDGMTYGVVNVTYKGYIAMIPSLTVKQKEQIMTWLVEAREHAMDAESSEKKHAWFGKYKGRINNYLSAAGYDLKKEGKEWEKRRNAGKEVKTNAN